MSFERYRGLFKYGEWDGGSNYEPFAGSHIDAVCEEVAEFVQGSSRTVTFKHNDVTITAKDGDTTQTLKQQWDQERERQHQAYLKSPKCLEDQRQTQERERHDRETVRCLLRELPSLIGDMPRLLDWLAKLSNEGGSIYGMKEYDPFVLANRLVEAGWERNWGVGQDPSWFEGEPERLGRYVIGQAIDCLYGGMPPHPVTISFVERYRTTQDT